MKISRIIINIIIITAVFVSLFPILFIFATSFMSPWEVHTRYTSDIIESNKDGFTVGLVHFVNISLIPHSFSLEQYTNMLFGNPTYLRMFWNSALLVIPILIGQVIIAPLAAYGFESIRFKYKETIYFTYIIVMLMPMQLLLVPNFIIASWLSIRESYLAIILPAMFHPLGVFLIRQQLKSFPREVLEAASLDGATAFQTYRKIIRPNLTSVVAALIVLLFADNWNIIDQVTVFIRERYRQPLSVYLSDFAAESPDMFFAASFFYIIPAILVFLWGFKHLTEGISLASIKH